MGPSQTLRRIQQLVRAGKYQFRGYAVFRMALRGASQKDVLHAIETAFVNKVQLNGRRYLVGHNEARTETLPVVVFIDDGIVIIHNALTGEEDSDENEDE